MFSVVRVVAVAMASLFGSNMESWSFPFNFDIARRYAEHLDCQTIRYGEQGALNYLRAFCQLACTCRR